MIDIIFFYFAEFSDLEQCIETELEKLRAKQLKRNGSSEARGSKKAKLDDFESRYPLD